MTLKTFLKALVSKDKEFLYQVTAYLLMAIAALKCHL